jgi:hypothetical protein
MQSINDKKNELYEKDVMNEELSSLKVLLITLRLLLVQFYYLEMLYNEWNNISINDKKN